MRVFLLSILITFSYGGLSQKTYINREWVVETPVVDTIIHSSSIVVSGKLVVTGNTVGSGGDADIITVKYNNVGDTIWSATYDGSAGLDDYGVELAATSSGDIIVVGTAQTTGGGYDYAVIKYNGYTGSQIWSYTWDGVGNGMDIPAVVGLDGSNRIYVAGGSESSGGFSDYGVIKLSPSGSLQWANYYDYNNLHDAATGLTVNNTRVTVTGASADSIGVWDIATVKFNTSNGIITTSTRSNIDSATMVGATAMVSDADNNVYITGYAEVAGDQNIQTMKLDSTLDLVWVEDYEGDYDDVGKDIGIDSYGNVYVTGHTNLSGGNSNFVTIKYDSDGNEVWMRELGNKKGVDEVAIAEKMAVSPGGNVYVTGTIERDTTTTIAFVKYNSSGSTIIKEELESDTLKTRAYDINLDNNDIYVTGLSETIDDTTYTVVKYSTDFRNPTAVEDSAHTALYNADELIIGFNPDSVFADVVNNPQINFGGLDLFVTQGIIDELDDIYPSIDWGRVKTYRIFNRLTTNDTLSITRTGEYTPIPKLWATFLVSIPSANEEAVMDSLNNLAFPSIEYAHFNLIYEPTSTPDDTYFTSNQYSLYPNTEYPDADIDAEGAWDLETGKGNILVGVYDTGIKFDHEDFGGIDPETGKIRGGFDYFYDVDLSEVDNNGDPSGSGHGTNSAGVIGALRNNNTGVAGIAGGDWPYEAGSEYIPSDPNETKGASLYGFKIGNDSGSSFELESILDGLTEGTTNSTTGDYGYGLHIMSCSFSGNLTETESILAMDKVQRTAFRNGTILVASKGNTGSASMATPAWALKEYWTLSVGGSNDDGEWYSGGSYGNGIDIVAPATLNLTYTTGNTSTSAYESYAGTSSAAPHVSGVAALMLSYINDQEETLNNLYPDDIEFLIERYARDIEEGSAEVGEGYDEQTGHGLIDAANVLDSIDKSKFIVKHHYDQFVFDSTATEVISTCGGGGPCFYMKYRDEVNPPGTYAGRLYTIQLPTSHTLNPGDVILNSWPINSHTNTFLDGLGEFWDEQEFQMSLTLVTNTSALVTGQTIHFLNGPEGAVDFWYPFGPGDTAKFAYTLHIETDYAGVDEEDELSNRVVSCYPNPTSDNLTVEFELADKSDVQLDIVDVRGNLVKSVSNRSFDQGQHRFDLDVDNFANGIYFINVVIDGTAYHEKFIKQ